MLSKSQVNRAGDSLRNASKKSSEYKQALSVAEEWRKAHMYPLKTFKSNLDKRLLRYPSAISAQRLKRMPTILDKLQNRETSMRLSAMQDIGGVRAIVGSVSQAEKLAKEYATSKRFTHIRKDSQCRDYIANPKDDGYRGIHLVYEYNNTLARTQSAKDSKGMLIEIQIRSELQHIWATAVETVGLMTGESLKAHRGDSEWLRFFQLVSSVFAITENRNVLQIHEGKEKREIYQSTIDMISKMKVFDKLSGYSIGIQVIDQVKKSHYYHLLVLDMKKMQINVTGYAETEYDKALRDYEEVESKDSSYMDAVLVSAGQRKELKKAYPNYYLDLKKFVELLDTITVEYQAVK